MLCNLQIFSGCVCHLEQLHAQSPFLFPIVFSINLIPFFDISSVLAVHSPGLFGYVLLYFTWATARSQELLFVVLACHALRALDSSCRLRTRRRVCICIGSTRCRGNHMHDHSRFQRDIDDVTGVSLSLYYSQKSLTHNIGSASALPIITKNKTQEKIHPNRKSYLTSKFPFSDTHFWKIIWQCSKVRRFVQKRIRGTRNTKQIGHKVVQLWYMYNKKKKKKKTA